MDGRAHEEAPCFIQLHQNVYKLLLFSRIASCELDVLKGALRSANVVDALAYSDTDSKHWRRCNSVGDPGSHCQPNRQKAILKHTHLYTHVVPDLYKVLSMTGVALLQGIPDIPKS